MPSTAVHSLLYSISHRRIVQAVLVYDCGKVNLPIVSIFAVAVGVGNEDVLLDDGDDGSSKSTPRQRTP